MARFRKARKKWPIAVLVAAICMFAAAFGMYRYSHENKDAAQDAAPVRESGEIVYHCNGCGNEYVGYFPVKPSEGQLASDYCEQSVSEIFETSRNDSAAGATEAAVFSRVTGNLSTREDVDFYRFTVTVQSDMKFDFSHESDQNYYTYLWDGTIYDTDGTTELKSGSIQNDQDVVSFGVSNLAPGTYYLRIRAARSGNPFMNGYSDANYHITFIPTCVEHASVTQYIITQPTCTQPGELMRVCDECDTIVSTEEMVPLDHIWSEWNRTKEGSLFSLGEQTRTCALCGEVEQKTFWLRAVNSQTPVEAKLVTTTVVQEPTCTDSGVSESVCSVCGYTTVETVAATGHAYTAWVTDRASTCAAEGEKSRACAVCGEVEQAAVEPVPHTYGDWLINRSSTCSLEGERSRVCLVCGEVEQAAITLLPHTYGGWITDCVSTCSTEGWKCRACTVCGEVETAPVKRLSHVYGEAVQVGGGLLNAPIVYEETCTSCGQVNRIEDYQYRWVLPAVIAACILFVGLVIAVLLFKNRRKLFKTHFVCPYCFETHKMSEAQFRCSNNLCKDVPDLAMTKYENGDIKMPKYGKPTFQGKEIRRGAKAVPKSAVCPKCRRTTHKVICPSCHNPLPESTLLGEDMIISIVGSRDTGKSHFVGVIVNELLERIAPAFGGSFEGFDDTMERYEQHFGRKLYVDLQKLDLTKSSLQNVNNGAYRPLIFSLKFKKKRGFKETINRYTLVFFDTAGEDLDDADTMSTVNKYICKSAGVIFLLDPMKIPAVAAQLDDDVIRRASSAGGYNTAHSDNILIRVSNLIRNDRGLKSSDKIDVPVAVVFSKFDVIGPIVPSGCVVKTTSPHCREKAFVLSDWHNVNTEIQGLLRTWGSESFLSQLDVNYTDYSCFAVSSLGLNNNPTSDRRISRPRPHRIEDPLLWILMKRKVIKGKK